MIPVAYASMINKNTGDPVTTGISVFVTKDAGVQTPGQGTLEYEGNSQWSYKPTTDEIAGVDNLGVLFTGNDSVPESVNLPIFFSTVATNTYGTIESADKYFLDERLNSDLWFITPNEDKKKALLQATKIIDNLNYVGCKLEEDQLLEFPRNFESPDINHACYEIAFALIDGVDLEYEAEKLNEQFISYGGGRISTDQSQYNMMKIHGIPSVVAWRILKKYLRPISEVDLVRVN